MTAIGGVTNISASNRVASEASGRAIDYGALPYKQNVVSTTRANVSSKEDGGIGLTPQRYNIKTYDSKGVVIGFGSGRLVDLVA